MKRKKNNKTWDALTQKQTDYILQAGWFEESKYSNGAPVGGIAAVQNYGAVINQNITEKQRKFFMAIGIFLRKTTTALHCNPCDTFLGRLPEGKQREVEKVNPRCMEVGLIGKHRTRQSYGNGGFFY